MNLIDSLNSPVAEALGWTLIHAIWQGFAVVLSAALLLHLARRGRAAVRYQIGMGGLLAQIVATAVTFGWYYEPRQLAMPSAMLQANFSASLSMMAPTNESWLLKTQLFLNAHLAEVVWIWLVGVAIFGVRLIGGWVYVQRLKTTATVAVPAVLADATARIARQLAVSASLQVSARAAGPMVVGILKPVVLWPVGLLAGLSASDVEAVLAHELAHVQRHDFLLNVLQSMVEVLYFFHPAMWWLSARVREEREHCCDDVAVEIIGDARILARALARVEEWQRTTEVTPDLAMAFANKRQLLLQRVRRMLGVPTRPLVSNGSLAGLTLVTMLLLSVSVYAVQQEKPKQKSASRTKSSSSPNSPAKTSRRHTVNKSTEYGMTEDHKVSYVIWKGQKLPATRVAQLQSQLDQVMNGQLSLDAVKQPDRDILLTIIETNNSFDHGMDAIANGLAHIDYNNIVADAMGAIPGVTDVNIAGLTKADFQNIVDKAVMDEFQKEKIYRLVPDTLDRKRAFNQQQLDSLSRLMSQQQAKMEALRLRMEKEQFAVEALERQRQTLNWKRENLMQQREKWLEKHQQLLNNDKPKAGQQADVEKLVTENEQKIRESEQAVEGVLKQLEAMQPELEKVRQPLSDLERQMEQIDRMTEQLSNQMSHHGDHLNRLFDQRINMNVDLNHNLNGFLNEDLNRAETVRANRHLRSPEFKRSMRPGFPSVPARAGRPARIRSLGGTIVPLPPALARPGRPSRASSPRPAVAPEPPLPEGETVPAIAPRAVSPGEAAPAVAPTPAPAARPGRTPKLPKPPKEDKGSEGPKGPKTGQRNAPKTYLPDETQFAEIKRLMGQIDATAKRSFKDNDMVKGRAYTITK